MRQMSEFCLKCFNRLNNEQLTDQDIELSDDLELCEGCGEYKVIVLMVKVTKSKFEQRKSIK